MIWMSQVCRLLRLVNVLYSTITGYYYRYPYSDLAGRDRSLKVTVCTVSTWQTLIVFLGHLQVETRP
jgi:hypothetical protein